MNKDFYVYMMTNKKGGVLYKGVTSDLLKRISEHKAGNIKGFSQKYNLKKLVWYRHCGEWEEAVRWEKRLRSYSRQWKINLIEETNLEWTDLFDETAGINPAMTGELESKMI